MKPETNVHYRLESVGRPKHTFTGEDTIKGVIIRIAHWLTAVPMGSKIRIVLARDASELMDRRSAGSTDLMGELESLLGSHEQQETDDGPA